MNVIIFSIVYDTTQTLSAQTFLIIYSNTNSYDTNISKQVG